MYIGFRFLGCEFRDTSDGYIDFYVDVDKKPNNKKKDDVFNNAPKRERVLNTEPTIWNNIEERRKMLPNLIEFLNCFLEDNKITEEFVIDRATEKFKEKIKLGKEK